MWTFDLDSQNKNLSLSFSEDQQLSATTQSVYTILDDTVASDEEAGSSTKTSNHTRADSNVSSTTPENFSDDDEGSDESEKEEKSFHSAELKAFAIAQMQQELPIVEIRVCPSTPNVFDSHVEVIEVQETECVEQERRKTKEEGRCKFN